MTIAFTIQAASVPCTIGHLFPRQHLPLASCLLLLTAHCLPPLSILVGDVYSPPRRFFITSSCSLLLLFLFTPPSLTSISPSFLPSKILSPPLSGDFPRHLSHQSTFFLLYFEARSLDVALSLSLLPLRLLFRPYPRQWTDFFSPFSFFS